MKPEATVQKGYFPSVASHGVKKMKNCSNSKEEKEAVQMESARFTE